MGVLMKYIFILLLAGCHSVPPDLVGNWSGKTGPYKSTFQLNEDGTGTLCYSRGKKNEKEWIKYRNGIIYTKRNTEMVIDELEGKRLTVEVDEFGVETYVFHRDEHLKKASWFCWRELSVK